MTIIHRQVRTGITTLIAGSRGIRQPCKMKILGTNDANSLAEAQQSHRNYAGKHSNEGQ